MIAADGIIIGSPAYANCSPATQVLISARTTQGVRGALRWPARWARRGAVGPAPSPDAVRINEMIVVESGSGIVGGATQAP